MQISVSTRGEARRTSPREVPPLTHLVSMCVSLYPAYKHVVMSQPPLLLPFCCCRTTLELPIVRLVPAQVRGLSHGRDVGDGVHDDDALRASEEHVHWMQPSAVMA